MATVDHNIPTEPRGTPITDLIAAKQIAALQNNCKEFGIRLFDMDSPEQGIVHVIGPELGLATAIPARMERLEHWRLGLGRRKSSTCWRRSAWRNRRRRR